MMRVHGLTVGLSLLLAAGIAACSSSTAPSNNGSNPGGGSSNTITANYSVSGGSYGSGGSANWYFAPTPDTVSAGTAVTFSWSGAQHNIHWDTPNSPDSIPTSSNESTSLTFSTAGTYNYHCTIHSMSGVVVVH
jgi:plastocyanin